VASALTVTPAATGAARSFGAGEAASGGAGGFAALLDDAEPGIASSGSASRSSEGGPVDLASLVKLALGFEGEGADSEPEAGDPVAAVVMAPTLMDTETDRQLSELIDSLAALKSALDAGETLDPELVDDLLARIDALGGAAAGLRGAAGDDLAGQLGAALMAMSQKLAGAAASEDSAATEAARKLGLRLDALAGALAGEGAPEGAAASNELRQAIERLLQSSPATAEVPEEPELAPAALKLDEPVLLGKGGAGAEAAVAEARPSGQNNDARPNAAAERNARPPEPASPAPPAAGAEPSGQPAVPGAADASLRIDAAAPRVIQAGYQTSQQQLNLPQLAFEIVRQVNEGNTRFQIRLDPPELGKIDVRLDFDRSGQVTARLTVEKAETLDLMQRDQRALERALQQAGLDGQKTNLEFSLKQNPFAGQGNHGQDGQGQGQGSGRAGLVAADTGEEPPPPTVNLYRGSLTASGVNIIA